MTRIFIHVEAPLSMPARPYRLSACTLDRNRVFEANIAWEGVERYDDELSRMCAYGKCVGTTDGANTGCYGDRCFVADMFLLWLEGCSGEREVWTKSLQQSWREMNALGLHILPVYDLSTFARLSGLDFSLESALAHRDAIGKAGANSPRMGAYESSILFNSVRHKTKIFK